MKKFSLLVLLLICSLLLTGCTSKKNKQVVNVLNWSSYIPDEVIKDFEKGKVKNFYTYKKTRFILQILYNNLQYE